MRIALITPEYPGCGPSFGIGRYVQLLARSLTQFGDAVCVVVISENGTWLGHADEVHPVSHLHIPALLRPWWTHTWLERVLNDLAPDIVEVPNWGGLGAMLPKQWPVLVRLSTSIAQERAPDRFRKFLQAKHLRLEIATVRRADWVVADSHTIASYCAPLYRRQANSIIPHALPFAAEQAVPSRGTEVLFVGRLDYRKGIDVLIRAWPHVLKTYPQAHLHIVGKDRRGISKLFKQINKTGITFHGRLSDAALENLYRRCAIQVVPSRFESFGLVILEAWTHGVAVIASDIPALQATVANAGLLFPTEDHLQLATAIQKLLSDKTQATTLQHAGFQRLQQHHHLASWIAATRNAYSCTIAQARRRQQKKL